MTTNYCESCGSEYTEQQKKVTLSYAPNIQCATCGDGRLLNSTLAVGVLLQPVVAKKTKEVGLLVIRRSNVSHSLYDVDTLPECSCHHGKSIRETLFHEFFKETGIGIDPKSLRDFGTRDTNLGGYVDIFFLNDTVLHEKDFPSSPDRKEKEWRIITTYKRTEFISSSHKEMVKKFFDELWWKKPDR